MGREEMFKKRLNRYQWGCFLFIGIIVGLSFVSDVNIVPAVILIGTVVLFAGAYYYGEMASKGKSLEIRDLSDGGETKYEIISIIPKNIVLIQNADAGMDRVDARFLKVFDSNKFPVGRTFRVVKEITADNFSHQGFKEGNHFIIPA